MIKKIAFLILFVNSITINLFAQDTSAYEIQRLKINNLLAERSAKFGQYDESLNTKTGIFGFQTKRDIRNSNEILRQIALNDNDIFKELKILLDYKDLQVEEVKTTVNTNSESIQNYRRSIKNLQDQNENLTNSTNKAENSRDLAYLFTALFLIGCAVLAYFLNLKNKQLKNYEKANV
ncbi:hypothetical protein GM921_06080 [Pedobacter sp. LMG 31464]|uniref:Uncharacterized protein n=1 Tax=Pedobacter planticolens TaxID=2679964 RepID=A0A923E036_9SPHI|nr:hypothetical protein [Pedobacter planticolens]MBB2145042.1 hypothetical protein [Pedobacter planticolens]